MTTKTKSCTSTKLKYLSRNSKLLYPSFDITLNECQKSCNYFVSKLCYAKNNPRIMIYNKPKNLRNEALLNSKSFVSTIKKEILLSNSRKIRFFSAGDIYKISHLEKIERLCLALPNIQFWLSTHNEFLLSEFYKQDKKPVKNLNIILSNSEPNTEWELFLKKYWNKKRIATSSTTNEKSLSNCHSSVEKSSCDLCEKCFTGENITYFIHGKYADMRLKRYEDQKE